MLGRENGVDVFVHRLAIRPREKVLRKGEYVSFNLLRGSRGPLANQVSRLSKHWPSTMESSSGVYAPLPQVCGVKPTIGVRSSVWPL
ncbi:cold-shock protein [Tunturiibacter gelidoferens]|uniref:cold-shock protein n=1 Tax=Tunturiibacter gelidiferens TaxID=3069689 RepID=UPI0032B105B3